MEMRKAFGQALRMARKSKGISQEDLSDVSSRTYVSALERGIQSPTLEKIDQLATELGIHGLTLIAAAFARRDATSVDDLLAKIRTEIDELQL